MRFPIWDWSLWGVLKEMEMQHYTRTQMGMRHYISDYKLFPKYGPHEIAVRVGKFFKKNKIVQEM